MLFLLQLVWTKHKNDIVQLSLINAFMCMQRRGKHCDPWVKSPMGQWVSLSDQLSALVRVQLYYIYALFARVVSCYIKGTGQ